MSFCLFYLPIIYILISHSKCNIYRIGQRVKKEKGEKTLCSFVDSIRRKEADKSIEKPKLQGIR